MPLKLPCISSSAPATHPSSSQATGGDTSTPSNPVRQASRQRGQLEGLKKAPPAPPPLPGAPQANVGMAKRIGKALRAQVKSTFRGVTKDGASRLDWNTPFSAHSRAGRPTTLRDFAHVKQSVERIAAARSDAPQPGSPTGSARRTEQALNHAMSGLRTQISAITNASASLHGGQTQGAQALQHVDDVIAYWETAHGQALAVKVSSEPEAFVAGVREMAAAHSPAVAMAVSLALVSAKERFDPDNATTLNGDIFSYLKHADLGAEIGSAKTHSETSRDTHILALRGALEQTRDALMAHRCTAGAGSGGEASSAPSHTIDVKALQAFIQTVRDFPIAMRGAARHAPQALAQWPGVRESFGQFDARNAEAAAACLATLEAVADEIGSQSPAHEHNSAVVVSAQTAENIRHAQEAMIATVSTPTHLHTHDQQLKHAEAGRAVAWGALQHAATTGNFEAMLAATGNRNLSATDQGNLRVHLQAGAAIATALKAKPTPEALIAARLAPHEAVSSATNFAQRVSDASAKLIHGAGPSALSAAEKSDLVAWRNGFTDDAPGSDLSQFKARMFKSLAWVDRMDDDRRAALPSHHKSPLSAARIGMAQGDRAVLANEQKALMAELAKPAVNEVVQAVAVEMERLCGSTPPAEAASGEGAPVRPETLSDTHCQWIALRVALEDWMPEHQAARQGHQLVLGREFSPAALPEAVEQRIRKFTEDAAHKVTSGSPEAVEQAIANVRQHLGSVRLGLEDVHALANFLNVEQPEPFQKAMEAARKIATAPPLAPADRSQHSVRAMLVDYLKTIPGGNTVRFSRGTTGGFSTKGITKALVNAKKRLLGVPVAGNARVDLRYEKGREAAVSMSYPVHAAELFIGTEKRHRGRIGAGCFFGAKLFKCCRTGANVDVNPYEHERTDATGIMVRIPRRTAAKDAEVRALFSRVTDFMFSAADARRRSPEGMPDADALFHAFASEFYAEHDLSLSWINQKTRAHRSEMSVGIGASVTKLLNPSQHRKSQQETGALGASLGYSFEKQWLSTFKQLDATGTYRIANLREQKLSRHKVNLGLTTSAVTGTTGNTSADLFGGGAVLKERGTNVKLRLAIDRDNVLPTKSVADFEFDSFHDYARYVEATKHEWVKFFAYPHRNDPDGGQAKGLKAVNDNLDTARLLDSPYNAFFVRRALTTEAAKTLNELQQLSLVTPPSETKLHEQLAASYTKTINAPDSWMPIGLRAYEKYSEADGFNVNAGLRLTQSTGLKVERQIVFDTIDAKLLKEYEAQLKEQRAAPPASVPPQDGPRVPPSDRPMQRQGSSGTPLYQSVQGARSEIEAADDEVDHESVSVPPRGQRSSSLADMLAMSPPRARPDDTRAHLERLKQQMDAKAGISAAPKKSGAFSSKLFGQNRAKLRSAAARVQEQPASAGAGSAARHRQTVVLPEATAATTATAKPRTSETSST
ncbi:hypothetical protein R16034_00982 [Ralstonia edaphis]|uniref:Type III effector protein n=1 Tax=Ralstonia edaphi TaxID=3058599 RepID=A0AB72X1H8_9RALS|nr:hypothetical protein R16034_00982 [Ralstonia sp. LMG 6871]